MRLSGGLFGGVYQFDGEFIHPVGRYGIGPEAVAIHERSFPMRPDRSVFASRAILERSIVHIPDVFGDHEYSLTAFARTSGQRAVLSVPMLRDGNPIGAISVAKGETGPFSPRQIELLKTFADQAVIAIENVRLFTELQTRNRELTAALDTQTATSDILRVISRSQTDVQPVFDTIVQSAARLCHAANAGVFLTDGQTLDLPANYGSSSPEALATARAQYPRPLDLETTAGVAILTRSVIHVPDIEEPSAAEVYTQRVDRGRWRLYKETSRQPDELLRRME